MCIKNSQSQDSETPNQNQTIFNLYIYFCLLEPIPNIQFNVSQFSNLLIFLRNCPIEILTSSISMTLIPIISSLPSRTTSMLASSESSFSLKFSVQIMAGVFSAGTKSISKRRSVLKRGGRCYFLSFVALSRMIYQILISYCKFIMSKALCKFCLCTLIFQ